MLLHSRKASQRTTCGLLLLGALAAGGCGAPTEQARELLYTSDFETVEEETPLSEMLILDGDFQLEAQEGNRVLVLPGNPLGTMGLLFGPARRENVAVRARVFTERTGRRASGFGVGLLGVGGCSLLVSANRGALELMVEEQVVASQPYKWTSGTWTHLRLDFRRTGESQWQVRGKAWPEGAPEPEEWMLSAELEEQLPPGRAALWGIPYAGKAILYDDLQYDAAVEKVAADERR